MTQEIKLYENGKQRMVTIADPYYARTEHTVYRIMQGVTTSIHIEGKGICMSTTINDAPISASEAYLHSKECSDAEFNRFKDDTIGVLNA